MTSAFRRLNDGAEKREGLEGLDGYFLTIRLSKHNLIVAHICDG